MNPQFLGRTTEVWAISDELEEVWRQWFAGMDNMRNHVDYAVSEESLQSHIAACMSSARGIIRDVLSFIGKEDFRPKRVLDIGCSTGFKALALQERFQDAEVIGIDPDARALAVARRTGQSLDISSLGKRPLYQLGVGEALPYDNDSIDLVVSTTVIEHVNDVDQCVNEVARVLRPGGFFYIEAPNYLWPYEPHLNVVMPPLCPKPLLRMLAKLQGRRSCLSFIEHLRFVHPFWIERRFRLAGLAWENGVQTKFESILSGDLSVVRRYRLLATLLQVVAASGLGRYLCRAAVTMRIYPSMIYLAQKLPKVDPLYRSP